MGGTRIVVLQMRELIKTAVLAALGVALIILLVVLFIPKEKPLPQPSSLYIPGTYSSSIILYDQPVDVSVTVSDNEITAVEMAEIDGLQRTFYPLLEPTMADLSAEVLRYQSADIVIETEHPVTASILQQAVLAALDQGTVPK